LRSGYSFRAASGSLDDVMNVILEHQAGNDEFFAPISDRASTFGWVKWAKLASKKGAKPVFGVELAVTDSIHAKKPSFDHWTFFARDDIGDVNRLVELATTQFRYQPLLTYQQALMFPGTKIIGHRSSLEAFAKEFEDFKTAGRWVEMCHSGLYFALGPSTVKGYARGMQCFDIPPIAASDNKYPRPADRGLWEVICGRGADGQSYPQHIMSQEEWRADLTAKGYAAELIEEAEGNALSVMKNSAAVLKKAKLLVPEKPKTLRQMCIEGAARLGCDLTDAVYRARMDRELDLIAVKGFEDYFYIVQDICEFARANMLVGPARGSSCGSLVCYLIGITTVDPIPYGLIFERFIDINRGGWFVDDKTEKALKELLA
jgi:DNA polymerase III alpha subunit